MSKKRRRHSLGRNGFTYIEVLAAFFILLIISLVLLFAIRFAAKMENRTNEIEMARREIGMHLMDKSECTYGTVRLDMDGPGEDIVRDGWLYVGENKEDSEPLFEIIWVEDPVLSEEIEDECLEQAGE